MNATLRLVGASAPAPPKAPASVPAPASGLGHRRSATTGDASAGVTSNGRAHCCHLLMGRERSLGHPNPHHFMPCRSVRHRAAQSGAAFVFGKQVRGQPKPIHQQPLPAPRPGGASECVLPIWSGPSSCDRTIFVDAVPITWSVLTFQAIGRRRTLMRRR
jgi:hypothetical protein